MPFSTFTVKKFQWVLVKGLDEQKLLCLVSCNIKVNINVELPWENISVLQDIRRPMKLFADTWMNNSPYIPPSRSLTWQNSQAKKRNWAMPISITSLSSTHLTSPMSPLTFMNIGEPLIHVILQAWNYKILLNFFNNLV